MAAWIQASLVIAVVVGLHVPLGDYMARALEGGRHSRAEKALYRVCGIDPDKEQTWRHYLVALLAFSLMSIAALFALFTLQGQLPWSTGHDGMPWQLALHTAVSFTSNTSWQDYAGESTNTPWSHPPRSWRARRSRWPCRRAGPPWPIPGRTASAN